MHAIRLLDNTNSRSAADRVRLTTRPTRFFFSPPSPCSLPLLLYRVVAQRLRKERKKIFLDRNRIDVRGILKMALEGSDPEFGVNLSGGLERGSVF